MAKKAEPEEDSAKQVVIASTDVEPAGKSRKFRRMWKAAVFAEQEESIVPHSSPAKRKRGAYLVLCK